MLKTRVLFAAAVLWSFSALGDEVISYTRFLVPLYQTGVHGAFGSIWDSSTWVLYTGQEATTIIPRTVVCEVQCPGLGGILYTNRAPQPLLPEFASDTGVLAYVPSDHAGEVAFGSRVRDVTRDAESAGTEVPVVPEREIVQGPIYLMDVRVGAQMRGALRIFALPEISQPEVIVRFYRSPVEYKPDRWTDAIELLGERHVPLRESQQKEGMFLYPSFAILANLDQLPELAGEESVWIEIVPVTPGLRIWAMASMTNNETQQITLVTPHHQ